MRVIDLVCALWKRLNPVAPTPLLEAQERIVRAEAALYDQEGDQ